MRASEEPAADPLDRIVMGTRDCFERSGVRKSSIGEIARVSKLARQTVFGLPDDVRLFGYGRTQY